ncbi:MAG: hypothetical protein HY590_03880 [Candidatus Omnitrophica bacterium]|nr:hypothetical protein [Candidatus Omnitrophota bacterium]
MKPFAIVFLILLLLWSESGETQTLQQDRRIEEGKRESLKPTLVTPQPAPAIKPPEKPPVPEPLKEIYFINLLPKKIVYRYDAAKSIVILMGVDDEYIALEAQIAYLKEKNFLHKRFEKESFDPMEPLRRGTAAYIFYKALGMKGGIALHLFGPTERYALKELVFQGIMSPGHVNDLLSGQELVQIMSQAARYKLEHEPPKQK